MNMSGGGEDSSTGEWSPGTDMPAAPALNMDGGPPQRLETMGSLDWKQVITDHPDLLRAAAYSEFLEDLCKQTSNEKPEERRQDLTFIPLAPACVVICVLTPIYATLLPFGPLVWRLFWILVSSTLTYTMLTICKIRTGWSPLTDLPLGTSTNDKRGSNIWIDTSSSSREHSWQLTGFHGPCIASEVHTVAFQMRRDFMLLEMSFLFGIHWNAIHCLIQN
ncbi:protein POLLEN DEFECTIVE IN GUIDANCE 1-like isoform X1 [Iris pallida]|uniref:Protein POLLEN DEFECTIVE IN GUIDANCE 1-like isoform X1 n=1 Tax=Iris pallida TaxID=29817 RepID=A0AAX6FJS9_IRIPA|nr:protein POLLEN DEFECTIVE IN GUIDANCE 1-like isoform X1 [Iris pallida]